MVRHLSNGTSKTINWVDSYLFSNDGSKLAVTLKKEKNDSLAQTAPGWLFFPTLHSILSTVINFSAGCPLMSPAHAFYVASVDSAESGTRKLAFHDRPHGRPPQRRRDFPVDPQGSRKHLMKPQPRTPRLRRGSKKWEKRWNAGELMINQYSEPVFSRRAKGWLSAWLLMWLPTTPRL